MPARIRSRARAPRALLSSVGKPIATAVAIGSLLAGPSAAAPADLDDVRGILRSSESDHRSQEDVVAGLTGLGSGAVPTLLDLCLGTADLFEPEEAIELSEWWCGPDEFGHLYAAALSRMPAASIVDYLQHRVPDDAEHNVRLTAVRILGANGSGTGLEELLRLGESFGELGLRYRSVQLQLENAFETVLERDPRTASRRLADLIGESSTGVRTALLTAMVHTGRPEFLSVIAALSSDGSELGLHVVDRLPELVAAAPWRFDNRPCEIVRRHLAHVDWRYRRSAALALGEMRDVDSFRSICLLLDDGEPAVTAAARWALANMAGTTVPSTSTEWLAWLDEQVAWWEDERPALLERLESDETRGAAEAIRELVARPLFRDGVALDFAALTRNGTRPRLVLASVGALEQLGSRGVLPDLLTLAESRDASIRAAALAALARLTGAAPSPDPATWRRLIEG